MLNAYRVSRDSVDGLQPISVETDVQCTIAGGPTKEAGGRFLLSSTNMAATKTTY